MSHCYNKDAILFRQIGRGCLIALDNRHKLRILCPTISSMSYESLLPPIGLGESGVLDGPGADVPLPSVAYFTPSTQANSALKGRLKKPRKLGVIKE